MSLQRGSLVVCVYDFWREKEQYPNYKFPNIDDLLVVRGTATNYSNGRRMCTFEELYTVLPLPLLAEKFVELQTPEEGEAILKKWNSHQQR